MTCVSYLGHNTAQVVLVADTCDELYVSDLRTVGGANTESETLLLLLETCGQDVPGEQRTENLCRRKTSYNIGIGEIPSQSILPECLCECNETSS